MKAPFDKFEVTFNGIGSAVHKGELRRLKFFQVMVESNSYESAWKFIEDAIREKLARQAMEGK